MIFTVMLTFDVELSGERGGFFIEAVAFSMAAVFG